MVFGRNFCKKDNLGTWTTFWERKGVARPWLMAHCKAHGRLFIRVNWTFFAICYGSGVIRLNMYSWAVFLQGVDLFALKFCVDSVVPINYSWRQKTRDMGYWAVKSEDRIPLRSLVLTQYRSVTDRRTDGFAVAYTLYSACKFSFGVL